MQTEKVLEKVETVEKGLTIEQASELLGVSKDTIRRRIRKGELNAIKRVGPYGDQFFIDESELDIATEIKEVIPIVRNLSLQDFSRTMENVLESAICKAIAPMQQQIEGLATDNKALASENKALLDELQAIKQEQQRIDQEQQRIELNRQSRDAELMQNIRLIQESQEQQKKAWWQRILGSRDLKV